MNMLDKAEEKEKTALAGDPPVVSAVPSLELTDISDPTTETASSSVDIQGMPKEFRDYHPIAGGGKMGGIIVMIVSFIFLIGVSIGVYFYILKPYLLEQTQTIIEVDQEQEFLEPLIIEPAVELGKEEPTQPEQTPGEIYNKFIVALLVTNSFDQYHNVMIKYASQSKITELEAKKLRIEAPSADSKLEDDFIEQNVPDYLTGAEQMIEQIEGKQAVIVISADKEDILGTIEFVVEDAQWKIDNVVWRYEEKIEVPIISSLIKANDRDNDGLTDSEEALLGSSKDSSDSDGDGYSDSEEVFNLYNPDGNDKLVDSPKISNYINDVYNYSIIYPNKWTLKDNAQKNSVLFISEDGGHFIQVFVRDNDSGLTVDAWYKKYQEVSDIGVNQIKVTDTWRGIKSVDGLYVYIQGDDKGNLFVVQYNPGQTNVGEYINMFQAMINSFVIQE